MNDTTNTSPYRQHAPTEEEELAREWMASPHWGGWLRGIVEAETGLVCVGAGLDGELLFAGHFEVEMVTSPVPDLGHAGTRAFLLEDVRKAWGEHASVWCIPASHMGGDEVRVMVLDTKTLENSHRAFGRWDDDTETCAASETEALMAALRAAP